jgi:hypothetical protein
MSKNWLGLLVLLLAGCSGMTLEGDCVATRKVELTLQCEGGRIETFRMPLPE